ncbi:MAG: endopeptidase [Gaiellaceae bacterium]|nr:endopeptidase [Gaiellaceae bacterium]
MAAGLWLVAAALLWRTRVPADLRLPHLDAARIFPAAELRRNARYARFWRWDWLAQTLAQLAALVALARASFRPRVATFHLDRLRGAPLGALAVLVAWLAALPFGLAGLWWDRRYGIGREGYGAWLLGALPALGTQLVVGAVVAAVLVTLARRRGRRWWLAVAPLLALAGVVVVAAQPLLGGGAPLHRPALVAQAHALERKEGAPSVRLEVEAAGERTREANADALGLGPTSTVVLWDTLLRRPFTPPQVRFVLAHELAHVARRHLWKGAAWFALFALPGAWLLMVAAERRGGLRDPRLVPFAALVLAVLQLAVLPLTNAISRRYEAEADWVALGTTRDPAAARSLFVNFARVNLTQPAPPEWVHVLLGDHPTLLERIEQAEAWSARR